MFRKRRKNKKFNYQSRYYESRREQGPFKIEYKFDEFRTTVGSNRGLKNKFKAAVEDFKGSRNTPTNKVVLIVILILVLLFLYIIDFDLSIFRQPL